MPSQAEMDKVGHWIPCPNEKRVDSANHTTSEENKLCPPCEANGVIPSPKDPKSGARGSLGKQKDGGISVAPRTGTGR